MVENEEVKAVVDIDRRLDIARNHTATHLLQSALRGVLGEHIQQRGSLVAPDRLRFDFSHLAPVTPDEINRVQLVVNDMIRRNLPVYDEETSYREAVNAGVIAIFDEKYGDVVRVLKIGKPAESAELCGGTHVSFTGEIGYFHVISEEGIGAGLRRIEAVTGRSAEAFIDDNRLGIVIADVSGKGVGEKRGGIPAGQGRSDKRCQCALSQGILFQSAGLTGDGGHHPGQIKERHCCIGSIEWRKTGIYRCRNAGPR